MKTKIILIILALLATSCQQMQEDKMWAIYSKELKKIQEKSE